MTDNKAALDAISPATIKEIDGQLWLLIPSIETVNTFRKALTATQPPQATDAQRRAALEDLAKVDYHPRSVDDGHYDAGFDQEQAGDFLDKHINTVYAALQSAAVPRGLTALIHDADSAVRHAQGFINMSGQKDLNEIQNATAWLNTAKENCIKALALLGGKEG